MATWCRTVFRPTSTAISLSIHHLCSQDRQVLKFIFRPPGARSMWTRSSDVQEGQCRMGSPIRGLRCDGDNRTHTDYRGGIGRQDPFVHSTGGPFHLYVGRLVLFAGVANVAPVKRCQLMRWPVIRATASDSPDHRCRRSEVGRCRWKNMRPVHSQSLKMALGHGVERALAHQWHDVARIVPIATISGA